MAENEEIVSKMQELQVALFVQFVMYFQNAYDRLLEERKALYQFDNNEILKRKQSTQI
jgi:hypothetical protein